MPDGSDMLRRVAYAARVKATEPLPVPLTYISAADLLITEYPPREMVLAPWLPTKGTAMVYGPRGIGKTHLTLGIAYAVASGGRFLRWHAPRPRRAVVIDGEMPAAVLRDRLAAIVVDAQSEPPDADHLRFIAADLQERGLDLSDPVHQSELEGLLSGADLIIVDNISTLASTGRENDAESWTAVQAWALAQRRVGRTVLFIHHAGKGGQQRGTSRREDILDTVIALRQPADHDPSQGARFEIHYEKNRGFYGDDAKPFEAALTASGWTTRDVTDADMARVVALADDGASVREIADELKMSKSRVSRIQQRARDLGLLGRAGDA